MALIRKLSCPIFGPKCSIFTIVMSVWGIIFLTILGVLFFVKYSLLFVDIGWEEDTGADWDMKEVLALYDGCARNCWIAAGLYVFTLVFAFWQHRLNQKGGSGGINGPTGANNGASSSYTRFQ